MTITIQYPYIGEDPFFEHISPKPNSRTFKNIFFIIYFAQHKHLKTSATIELQQNE